MRIINSLKLITITFSCLLIGACNNVDNQKASTISKSVKFENEGHRLISEMAEKVGDMKKLYEKKNVIYTYTYETPDGKIDISREKYIFDGELSYGVYNRHDRTFPQLEGTIEQGYDGNEFWLKHNGKILSENDLIKRVAFNRPTNFYWFTMLQKLTDPGLLYEPLGEKTIEGKEYKVVKISFEKKNDKPTDIYKVYINKETSLIDQFLFTVADFGKMEIPNLMVLKYETIDGLLIPTKRQYKQSTWNADVNDKPWIKVNWTDVKFNNAELKRRNFNKENIMNNK